MKKVLKFFSLLVVLALVGAGSAALYFTLHFPIKAEVRPVTFDATPTPDRLARGKVLVSVRCAGCHYNQKTSVLSGVRLGDAPPAFGTVYSHNITKHPTKGAGRYSDGELAYLLRTGIARDGRYTGPFMQSPHLSDEDLASIIAFLRSDDPMVAPSDADDRPIEPKFLFKMLMHVAWKPLPYPGAKIDTPPRTDRVAYGRYVAHGIGDCFACHAKSFSGLDMLHPEKSDGYFGGGNELTDAGGNIVLSPNITMDPETGIGKWSEDEFVRALQKGIRKDGAVLRYPMPQFGDLAEDELRAVYAYLKTVPPRVHAVPRSASPVGASASEGEKLYVKYACASCHGTNGVGVCDLREASKKYDSDDKLVAFIRDASKFVPGTKMPTWEGVVADTEFPSLVAHVHALERAKR